MQLFSTYTSLQVRIRRRVCDERDLSLVSCLTSRETTGDALSLGLMMMATLLPEVEASAEDVKEIAYEYLVVIFSVNFFWSLESD